MEKISISQNNAFEKNLNSRDAIVEKIKNIKERIEIIQSENQELFDEYERIRQEEVSFVMELAHYKCSQDDQEFVSQDQKLLVDYLVNGTVANSPYIKEEHNNQETIALINMQFKEGLNDTQNSDAPFDQEGFRKVFQEVSLIQNTLNKLREELSHNKKELLKIDFLEERENALKKYQEYFSKYTNLHRKIKQDKETIENSIHDLIQEHLDLGMNRDTAIEMYRRQPNSEILKTNELYELIEIIAEIEEIILNLEIHIEQISNAKYLNYDSHKEFANIQLTRKLNNEYMLKKYPELTISKKV